MRYTSARRTGRTTRLLEHAKAMSAQGKAVYIICASRAHAESLQAQLPKPTGIKCETWESLGASLDVERLRLRSAWPNVEVLVDHAAIESRFGPLLDMLYRYDATAQTLGEWVDLP